MKIRKFLSALFIGVASCSCVLADDVGQNVPAGFYDFESHSEDANIVRKMGSKVGYLKSDPEGEYVYWGYDNFDFGRGATHLTVRASSGSRGGTLRVCLATPWDSYTTVATVQIPNTGGWKNFQDFTVAVNQEIIAELGGRPLLFVVEQGSNRYQFDVESFRFDNAGSIGVDIPASSLGGTGSNDKTIIRPEGDRLVDIKNIDTFEYWWYDDFDFGNGATTFTVRASSGSAGGTLYVRLASFYNDDFTLARVDIPNTGGWNNYQDFTVALTPEQMAQYGFGPFGVATLYFVVQESSNPEFKFNIESFRFDND